MEQDRFHPGQKITLHTNYLDVLNGVPVKPIAFEISLTGVCNADCDWCFYKGKQSGEFINKDKLLKALRSARDTKSVTWTGGGEPTLHPDFEEIIKEVDKLGIEQGLITHGLKIGYNASIFKWIRVSAAENEWAVDNIHKLVKQNENVGLCINDFDKDVTRQLLDEAQIFDVKYIQVRPALESNGALTYAKYFPFNLQPCYERVIVSKYKYEDCGKHKEYDNCYGHNFVPFIWEDGTVQTCAYHRGSKAKTLGNIYEDDLREIVDDMPHSTNVHNTCMICCKNHEINKMIDSAKKIKDVNFV